MLDHPTHTQLREMRLDGMADAFEELQAQDGTADLTHAEWLGLLIDREAASRETKRFESRMRTARLRHVGAAPEDVEYKTRRGLDKPLDHCSRTNGEQGLAPAASDRQVDTRQTQPDDHRPLRCRQNLVGLRPIAFDEIPETSHIA